MHQFFPGLELNRKFDFDVVKPIITADFPNLQFSTARLGQGSEVLGYDALLSTDHDWGPRLQLFLSSDNNEQYHQVVNERLRHRLPRQFMGCSTHFSEPDHEGTRILEETEGPVNHRVEIWTVPKFFIDYMAYDRRQEPTVYNRLSWPQQHLLEAMTGAVYEDSLSELTPIRQRLKQYPHNIWLYLPAAQWVRISQEEHFVGRSGDLGDEIGSRLLASLFVHDLIQLCFLMQRTYAPYPKWFGTAFSELSCAPTLTPILLDIFNAQNWISREDYLCQAYEIVAKMHNALGITQPLSVNVRYFFNRPFRIIDAGRFADALKDHISEAAVRVIIAVIGSFDQFSHNTDLRSYPHLHKKLQSLYK